MADISSSAFHYMSSWPHKNTLFLYLEFPEVDDAWAYGWIARTHYLTLWQWGQVVQTRFYGNLPKWPPNDRVVDC
jgi:hypothetical protein